MGKDEDGYSLNFTVCRKLDDKKIRFEWVKMPFKNDFIRVLKNTGVLPAISVK